MTSVTTNGMLYPKFAEQLVGKVDALLFSIDSTDPEEHDRIRAMKSFHLALEALAAARRLRQPLYISHVVTNESYDHVDEMIRFAKDQGAILYLNPCFSFFGNEGLDPEKAKGLGKYFGKPGVIVDRAQLALIASGGNDTKTRSAAPSTSTVVISPREQAAAALLPLQGRRASRSRTTSTSLYHSDGRRQAQEMEGRHDVLRGLHGLLLHAQLADLEVPGRVGAAGGSTTCKERARKRIEIWTGGVDGVDRRARVPAAARSRCRSCRAPRPMPMPASGLGDYWHSGGPAVVRVRVGCHPGHSRMAGPTDSIGTIGIIGGSGVYEIDGLKNAQWRRVASPFGEPSDEFLFGELGGSRVVFLPRHGRGHRIPPSEINYRANIDALKRAGVTDLISLSRGGLAARGSCRPAPSCWSTSSSTAPSRASKSFFGTGLVAHVSMAHPVCAPPRRRRSTAARRAPASRSSRGGTYLVDGRAAVLEPRRVASSTALGLRRDRHDQHAGGQARPRSGDLLRDRRHGHRLRLLASGPRPCQVADIVRVMHANAGNARALLKRVDPEARRQPAPVPSGCDRALDTRDHHRARGARSARWSQRLDAVAGRVLALRHGLR